MKKNNKILAWIMIFALTYSLIGYMMLLINPGEGLRFAFTADLHPCRMDTLKSLPSYWIYKIFNYLFFVIAIWKITNVSRKTT